MKIRMATAGLVALLAAINPPSPLSAKQEPSSTEKTQSVWDGVYTREQANRGAALYAARCALCHGQDLTGGEIAPALNGGEFKSNWSGLSVDDLFERIKVSMPQNNPGSLSRQQTADIVAFVLFKNGFPPGMVELPREAEVVKQIRFEANKPEVASQEQSRYTGVILISTTDKSTAVLFRYFPPGDAIHYPLVIRAVESGDSRLNTSPMAAEGRVAYITLDEMSQLARALAGLSLSWQESEKVETLPPFRVPPTKDMMDIEVVTLKGTAKAEVAPPRICDTLKPLEPALKSSRALWEFQKFRLDYGCPVPTFNRNAYPDRE